MLKTKKGFTLAEVLTTLMVIGVVAAMTIPTLINSTEDQQKKVALKKAVSVLGQAVQLNVAKEEECGTINTNALLASCMARSLAGSVNGNQITTADGMVYEFYIPSEGEGAALVNATGSSIEQVCGLNFSNTQKGWLGAGSCGVVVDTNGFSKGTKSINAAFNNTGFTNTNNLGADQYALSLTASGVRPIYRAAVAADGDNPAVVANTEGYKYIYGGDGDTVPYATEGVLHCKKAVEGTPTKYADTPSGDGKACSDLGVGWVADN